MSVWCINANCMYIASKEMLNQLSLFQEHSFEVSLFAELFNEMLMRDFGFRIYKALYDVPERPKDEKEEKVCFILLYGIVDLYRELCGICTD